MACRSSHPRGLRVFSAVAAELTSGIGLVVLTISVGFAGCSSDSTPNSPSSTTTPATPVTLSGVVLDYGTGSGVPGTRVSFVGVTQSSWGTTDSRGAYSVQLATADKFTVNVGSTTAGTVYASADASRGDLYVDQGTCVARYGTIVDARTLKPIAGASVSLGGAPATTGADGWYRIDMGCPTSGWSGYNTTYLSVTRTGYTSVQQLLGMAVTAVRRVDVALEPL
jgi:hypothetical protein